MITKLSSMFIAILWKMIQKQKKNPNVKDLHNTNKCFLSFY